MRRLFFWTLGGVALLNYAAFAQVAITGKITNEKGNPVFGASVVVNKAGTNSLLAYHISDGEGMYKLIFSSAEEKVDIQVRSLGYKMLTKTVANRSVMLNLTLETDTLSLDELVVKAPPPITKTGDTVSYQVDAFAKVQDRSIADALRRMPGIEVLSDGKVLYQGKPINKYYIEGLDLLEGKYNLANSNLPHKEVSEVQVLENHQPIKILDSLQFSDKAALNIKLKNTHTLTGQAKIAAGVPPLLWDVNITPILITKKQQILAAYQTNNTGNNVHSQIKTLTPRNLSQQLKNKTEKKDLLSVQSLKTPAFSAKRWLNNNVHLLTKHYLKKLTKDYELRLNLSYLNDYQQQNGFTNTLFFTPADTVLLFEKNNNHFFFNTLEADFTLQRNTKKNYLKNNIQFKGNWNLKKGHLSINKNLLEQNLKSRFYTLSHTFETVFFCGNQLLTLNTYLGFSKSPQRLRVSPGQFKTLLNNGNPYNQTVQKLELQTLNTHQTLGFTKAWRSFSFSPKIGVHFKKQHLESRISIAENSTLPGIFKNNLNWKNATLYFDLRSEFKKNKWRIVLETPAQFHLYRIEDTSLQKRETLSRPTFPLRTSIFFDINAFWTLHTSASLRNRFGEITHTHYAYILHNYRHLQRTNTPLQRLFKQRFTAAISYRNPLKSFFWRLGYTKNEDKNNLLYHTKLLKNGAREQQAFLQNNNTTGDNINTQVGKYFGKLNTNTTFTANFSRQKSQQILNNTLVDIQYQNWHIAGKIDTDFTDWCNAEYQANALFSRNKIQHQPNKTLIQQSHLINLNFYPKKQQYLALKIEYIQNNLFSENTKNVFTDIIYQYSWKKKNIDFTLSWQNIFNTKEYKTTNINEFSYIETNFQIRPTQILLKVSTAL